MPRSDGREPNQLRAIRLVPHFVKHPDGAVLVQWGDTHVLCTASVDESVPPFLRDKGRGWCTAEYSMLPGSSRPRVEREAARGKVGGRTQEIQRLIGRSLRSVLDMAKLGPRTIQLDCDVLQADGGTRTAAITGAYVALSLAVRKLQRDGLLFESPLIGSVAAVSVGIIDGEPRLDLCYEEDSRAEVDMNFVMTGDGEFIEVQGTAEGRPFRREHLDRLTDLATDGVATLIGLQRRTLDEA